jgi:hypothetical protein
VGHRRLALYEFDRALELEPDDVYSHYYRAVQRAYLGHPGADDDFARVVDHPQVEAAVGKDPVMLSAFYQTVAVRVRQGRAREALDVAERAVRLAQRNRSGESDAYFSLARAYAFAAKSDPALAPVAFRHLKHAYQTARNPERVQNWYIEDKDFDDLRADFGAALFERD